MMDGKSKWENASSSQHVRFKLPSQKDQKPEEEKNPINPRDEFNFDTEKMMKEFPRDQFSRQ